MTSYSRFDQRYLVNLPISGQREGKRIRLLVPTGEATRRYLALLRKHDMAAMNLADYQGKPIDRVKVGTYHRAKGLDFKHVLLPQWNLMATSREPGETDAAHRERLERERRALFVAMTRARDGLWLGRIDPG